MAAAGPDPRAASELRDPGEIGAALLDLESDFDETMLDRLSAWMAVTTSTNYSKGHQGTAADVASCTSVSSFATADIDWSFDPSILAPTAASSLKFEHTLEPQAELQVQYTPTLIGSTKDPVAARRSGFPSVHPRIAHTPLSTVNLDHCGRSVGGRQTQRSESFSHPTDVMVADIILIQAHFRMRRERRWLACFRACRIKAVRSTKIRLFSCWQIQSVAGSHYHRYLKRTCFSALRSYTVDIGRLFACMAKYLDRMLGRIEYSAAAVWKLAQRAPVNYDGKQLSSIPTFLHSVIQSRLYNKASISSFAKFRENVVYWRLKRKTCRDIWRRTFCQRARVVLIIWHRFSDLMTAERKLQPIPHFEEPMPEWDLYFADYMRTAGMKRLIARLNATAIRKRAFQRMFRFSHRAGSKRQVRTALAHFNGNVMQHAWTSWSEARNLIKAGKCFFNKVFRRWHTLASTSFRLMRPIEQQLTAWVHRRSVRRCFQAMQDYSKQSFMLTYAAIRRMRSPFAQARVLRTIFKWQGLDWHVSFVDGWKAWCKFAHRRIALSSYVARHVVQRRHELLRIAFNAFRKASQTITACVPSAMDPCHNDGESEARVIEHAQRMFPEEGTSVATLCPLSWSCCIRCFEHFSTCFRSRYCTATTP